jgi:hypothetical protein
MVAGVGSFACLRSRPSGLFHLCRRDDGKNNPRPPISHFERTTLIASLSSLKCERKIQIPRQ